MKNRILLFLLVSTLTFVGRAAVLPQEVLPANAFAVATVPSVNNARTALKATPMAQLWNDPAMEAFAGKFEKAFEDNVLAPLELFADIKPMEYLDLAQGQVTLAITREPGQMEPGVIVLIDSGKKADALAEKLERLEDLLDDQGTEHERLRIRGTDFIRIVAQGGPGPSPHIGQSGSLLVVASSEKLSGQVVGLQKGDKKIKALAGNDAFKGRHKAQLHDALGYGWLNFNVVLEIIQEQIEANADPDAEGANDLLAITPERVIEALGFQGLRSISISAHQDDDGEMLDVFLDVPKAGRRGLFDMMAMDSEDVSPPAFVGNNVASFARIRLNGAGTLKKLEDMLTEINPAAAAGIGLLEGMLRANDPEFRLKEKFIDTIADDMMVISLAPRGKGLEELFSPRSLFLVKSTKPAVMLSSIISMAGMAEVDPEEREIEGRKVYTYDLGGELGPVGGQGVHLTTVNEYVVISPDEKTLTQFLKGPKKDAKKLADHPGLKEAAAKVGGLKAGAFAFENQKTFGRAIFKFLKDNPNLIEDTLGGLGGGQFIDPETGLPAGGPDLSAWLDFKLLPDFGKVAKYFHFTVSGLETTDQGIRLRTYAPRPPAIK